LKFSCEPVVYVINTHQWVFRTQLQTAKVSHISSKQLFDSALFVYILFDKGEENMLILYLFYFIA